MFETESRGLLRLLLAGICLFWGRAELIHVDISKIAVWCFESLCSLSVNLFLVWCSYSNHFLHTSYREWWRHNSERFSSFAEVLSPMFLLFVLHLTGWAGPHREAQGSHVCPACREEMANLLQQKEGKNLSLCSVSNLTSASTSLLLATIIFKGDEEGRGELKELAKCLHSAIFYTSKSKKMRKELFFMHWYRYRPIPESVSEWEK